MPRVVFIGGPEIKQGVSFVAYCLTSFYLCFVKCSNAPAQFNRVRMTEY